MSKTKSRKKKKAETIPAETGGFPLSNPYIYLFIVVLGLIIYANSLNVPFQYDDEIRITENPNIQNLSDIQTIWNQNKRRFIGYLTIAVNYHLSQEKVFGYHLFNIIIHLAASLTVYILIKLLFQTPRLEQRYSEKEKQYVSAGTALIFLCHPLQTQSVTYVIQRFTSITALCLFAVLYFYIKFRMETSEGKVPFSTAVLKYYIPAILITLIGIQVKETFIVLPGALILGEIYFFRNSGKEWPVRLIQITPFALLVSTILYFKTQTVGSISNALTHTAGISRSEYMMTQLYVLLKYIGMYILPVNQNLDHDIPVAQSFMEPRIFISFILLLAILTICVLLFRKEPLISFGIIWYYMVLSPQSSFIPIHDFMFEHRTYTAIPGLGLISSILLYKIIGRRSFKTAVIILGIITLSLSVGTVKRNHVWGDYLGFLKDVVKKSPNKARPHQSIANAYIKMDMVDKAIEQYRIAAELSDNHPEVLNNLGSALLKKGKTEEAFDSISAAIEKSPGYADAHYNLGNIYIKRNDYSQAAFHLRKAIEIRPRFTDARVNLGMVLYLRGNMNQAIRQFQEAVKTDREPYDIYNYMGLAFQATGEKEKAASSFRKALEIKPDYKEAAANLKNLETNSN